MCHLKIFETRHWYMLIYGWKGTFPSSPHHSKKMRRRKRFFVKTFPASIFPLNLPFVNDSCGNICTTIENKLMTSFNQCCCLINFHLLLNFCANNVNVLQQGFANKFAAIFIRTSLRSCPNIIRSNWKFVYHNCRPNDAAFRRKIAYGSFQNISIRFSLNTNNP